MPPFESIAAFVLASVLLALAPGPDNIFVLTQSLQHGRLAGVVITLGLCSGLVLHTLAVAFGVALFVSRQPWLFELLEIAGAVYLLYLAMLAWRDSRSGWSVRTAPQLSLRQYYKRGIFMNLSNPKVLLFFLALLPQFADPQAGSLQLQLLLLGLLFILSALLVFGLIALLAGRVRDWLGGHATIETHLQRLAAVVYVLLATRLLLV
ncbi:MAG: LysE family translocator [Chromatiales bacterium]|jgi:threonine/homoserine/homoserine lactone efflux protein